MRIPLSALMLCAAVAALAGDVRPTLAQSPQQHPYCALDSSAGATSCYYDSREACGPRCISNPGYAGPQGARARGYRSPPR